MQTVATKTHKSPTICLAIDSLDASETLNKQLSQLGYQCSHYTDIVSFAHSLTTETPSLVVVSLEFDRQCALQFCREHPKLLDEVPVVFIAADPTGSFEQALAAVRLGAVDVVVAPLSFDKLEKIASVASERSKLCKLPTKADFFVNNLTSESQSIAAQPALKITVGSQEISLEKFSPLRTESMPTHSTPTGPTPTGHDGGVPQVQTTPAQAILAETTLAETGPSKTTMAMSRRRTFAAPINGSNSAPTEGLANDSCRQVRARRAGDAARVKELEASILGVSLAMQAVRSIIAEVARTKANVMIYGASGTGKELVATALHKLSNRSKGSFQPVNMTEIPHDLAQSLLFGHERGSFTGAEHRQIGVCEAADGGTLFLDEIGEMPLATQPKLLRFLQEGTVKRIGSRNAKKVDVRVITATNRTPDTIVKEGLMREDLFFRLHVVPIHIPPLRKRPEDIEQLAMLFLRRYVKAYDRSVTGFTDEVLNIFRGHDWPGNVRQLENLVERLVVFAKGQLIDVPEIPAEIHAASMFDGVVNNSFHSQLNQPHADTDTYATTGEDNEAAVASMSAMQRTERAAIVEALQRANGHVIDAANLLGLGQATVYRKIKQYHIPHQRRRRRRVPK